MACDTLDEATDWARELRTRLGSYLPWPGPGGTQHAQPPTARPTATVQDLDGRPLDRDEYAAALSEQADPAGPVEGDLVRLSYVDGSTLEGTWNHVGGDIEGHAVITDDGRVHQHVTGQVRRAARVGRRGARPSAGEVPERLVVVDAGELVE